MSALKVAASLIAVYGIILLGNGLFYSWWSGDSSELPRLAVRLVGSALVACGLWTHTRWGWWFGVLFSGSLSIVGAIGLAAALWTGMLESRPYPAVDLSVLVTSLAVLAAALVCIALPQSRDAIRARAGATQR